MKYGDIGPEVAAYSVAQIVASSEGKFAFSSFVTKPGNAAIVDYLVVPCRVCEAQAGEPCRAVRRHVNWIGGKHAERMDDARCVTEAAKALMPQQQTVTFRRPR